MRTEHGISTPLGDFLYAFTDLLNNMADMAKMQTYEIAKRSEYEGTLGPKPAAVVMTVIDVAPEFDNHLDIVNTSAQEIPDLVKCVSNIVSDFASAVKENAAKANCDGKTTEGQEVSYWGCEKITEARWRTEQALCKLNAKVADLHVASHALFAGVELRLCCTPHPCEDGGTYVYNAPVPVTKAPSTASPSSNQTPHAKGKQSA